MELLAELEHDLQLAEMSNNDKVHHDGVWIGLGYANFLLRLYKARLKFKGV